MHISRFQLSPSVRLKLVVLTGAVIVRKYNGYLCGPATALETYHCTGKIFRGNYPKPHFIIVKAGIFEPMPCPTICLLISLDLHIQQ